MRISVIFHAFLSSDHVVLLSRQSLSYAYICLARTDQYGRQITLRLADTKIVKQASDLSNVSIVSIEWLCDSVKQKKNLDVQPYLMTESIDMSQTTVTHAQQKGTKRSRNGKNKMDQNDDDDVKSNASIKSEDEDDQDDHVAKKQRDGQKVKMKSLHIPVDGPCGLSRKLPFNRR